MCKAPAGKRVCCHAVEGAKSSLALPPLLLLWFWALQQAGQQ
jgi:hypothetical protein